MTKTCLICREFDLETDVTGNRIAKNECWLVRDSGPPHLPGILDVFPREHIGKFDDLETNRQVTWGKAQPRLFDFCSKIWEQSFEEVGTIGFPVGMYTPQFHEHDHSFFRIQPLFFVPGGLTRREDHMGAQEAAIIRNNSDILREAFRRIAASHLPAELETIFIESPQVQ